KRHDQVQRLIAGPGGVYICNECVALCQEIIDEIIDKESPHSDQPMWQASTTMGQASVPSKDETPQPTPTPCPECKSERMLARVSPEVRLVAQKDMSPGLSSRWTEMWAFV